MAVPLAGVALSRGVLGRAETALALAEEASAMLHDGMGPEENLYVLGVHAWGLHIAGHFPQAIEAFDHIVERSGGDPHVGREVIGFSPSIWADDMAARTLASAG